VPIVGVTKCSALIEDEWDIVPIMGVQGQMPWSGHLECPTEAAILALVGIPISSYSKNHSLDSSCLMVSGESLTPK